MEIKSIALVLLAGCLAVVLLGCRPSPEPTVTTSPLASPLDSTPSEADSPMPSAEPIRAEPGPPEVEPLQLDKPIPAGSTKVTGSGPPGVPIVLMDITFGGNLLASGVIGEDGKFQLTLDRPLEARHRIGVTLGELSGTQWQREDFADERFYGDEALSVPQVGFFYDTYMVRE